MVWSWALYDFANSSFTTLVVTFVYATYFTQQMAANENEGTQLWSWGVSLTAIIVALVSPYVGAMADRGGYRRLFLLISTLVCIVGTTVLYFAQPGQIVMALVFFTLANIAFEMGHVFYNAYLPDIAPPAKIGRISGYGWGLGYIGGLLCLGVALVGFVFPEQPWFGFSTDGGENVRATNLLVACWYAVFSLPLFLFIRDQRTTPTPWLTLVRYANRQIVDTYQEIRQYKQIFRFLLARLIYNDGLVTIFAFGGIYAAGTFGFDFQQIIIFGIVLNVAAGLGAYAFGFLDDKIGGKQTVLISIVVLFAATLVAVFTTSATMLWAAGILLGLCLGPNQSASRSLMGRFVPHAKQNEFFGFFAFSGKATSFLGPLLVGWLTASFESQRVGISIILLFLLVGGLLMLRVDEADGIRLADEINANP